MIDEPIFDFELMDERFARAMLAAGYEITSPSSYRGQGIRLPGISAIDATWVTVRYRS